MSDTKPIVVVHPEMHRYRKAVAALEAAGCVVVVGDPQHIHVIATHYVVPNDPIASAAFETLEKARFGEDVRETFGKRVLSLLTATSIVANMSEDTSRE